MKFVFKFFKADLKPMTLFWSDSNRFTALLINYVLGKCVLLNLTDNYDVINSHMFAMRAANKKGTKSCNPIGQLL